MYKIVDTNTKDIFLGSETAVIRYAQDLLDDQDSDWKDDHFWELQKIDVKTFKGAVKFLLLVSVEVVDIGDCLDDLKNDALVLISQEE